MHVSVKKLIQDAQLPTYQSNEAACFDLCSVQKHIIHPNSQVLIGTGLAIEIPSGHVLLLYSRSGHSKKGLRLANCVGVIDSDYRGEILANICNDSGQTQMIAKGERIVQGMILALPKISLKEASELTATVRGSNGFGSTGT